MSSKASLNIESTVRFKTRKFDEPIIIVWQSTVIALHRYAQQLIELHQQTVHLLIDNLNKLPDLKSRYHPPTFLLHKKSTVRTKHRKIYPDCYKGGHTQQRSVRLIQWVAFSGTKLTSKKAPYYRNYPPSFLEVSSDRRHYSLTNVPLTTTASGEDPWRI